MDNRGAAGTSLSAFVALDNPPEDVIGAHREAMRTSFDLGVVGEGREHDGVAATMATDGLHFAAAKYGQRAEPR